MGAPPSLGLPTHQGRRGAIFERLLTLCNDVGLLAEEYDPRTKRQLVAAISRSPGRISPTDSTVTPMNGTGI